MHPFAIVFGRCLLRVSLKYVEIQYLQNDQEDPAGVRDEIQRPRHSYGDLITISSIIIKQQTLGYMCSFQTTFE